MGFKKGRAARAAAAAVTAANSYGGENLHVEQDGACILYTAGDGSKYRVDLSVMQQLNLETGMERAVYRKRPETKGPWHWEFQAYTQGARNYTPPKCIAIALEECWQELQSDSREDASDPNAQSRRLVAGMDDKALKKLFMKLQQQLDEQGAPNANDADGDADIEELAKVTIEDEALRHNLADRLLNTKWGTDEMLSALRCLLRCGLQPSSSHCRAAALGDGSLSLLHLLLVEARVDVIGLVLFEAGKKSSQASVALSAGKAEGSWVQRSKEALKSLMARGAVLGSHAPRSKLLRKIEEDGNMLWIERALTGFSSAHPEIPDCVSERIRSFL